MGQLLFDDTNLSDFNVLSMENAYGPMFWTD